MVARDNELRVGNPEISAGITNFLAGRPVQDRALEVAAPAFAKSKSDLVDPRGR